jgi:hypothetical protein
VELFSFGDGKIGFLSKMDRYDYEVCANSKILCPVEW